MGKIPPPQKKKKKRKKKEEEIKEPHTRSLYGVEAALRWRLDNGEGYFG